MDEEVNRLKSQVALLLACSRTRLDKAKWTSIQTLLQNGVYVQTPPDADLGLRLVRERDYLRAIIEKSASKEPAIMKKRGL